MPEKKVSKKTAPAKAATKNLHSDGKHLSKAGRQKRLFSRTDSSPGEATLMRSKGDRQKRLIARTDRTK